MTIACLWRYGNWRHVATGCTALVLMWMWICTKPCHIGWSRRHFVPVKCYYCRRFVGITFSRHELLTTFTSGLSAMILWGWASSDARISGKGKSKLAIDSKRCKLSSVCKFNTRSAYFVCSTFAVMQLVARVCQRQLMLVYFLWSPVFCYIDLHWPCYLSAYTYALTTEGETTVLWQ